MVILVDTFALTYRKFRFLRLTNILSGNELIEFDRKCLWKNMTNIMGKDNDTQSSSQWLTIHHLYAHVIANVVIDGASRTQHRERSNVILRNYIRIGTFQKCLSDSYLRPFNFFPLISQKTTWTRQVIAFCLACDCWEGLGYFQMQIQHDNVKPR